VDEVAVAPNHVQHTW